MHCCAVLLSSVCFGIILGSGKVAAQQDGNTNDTSTEVRLVGPIGYIGPLGATGERGSTGLQGPKGIPGPTGGVGEKGDRRLAPSGLTGAQGEKGVKGEECVDGEEECTTGLFVGEKGVRGRTGGTGLTGSTGYTGAQGPQGRQGDKGEIGFTGATGQKGEPSAVARFFLAHQNELGVEPEQEDKAGVSMRFLIACNVATFVVIVGSSLTISLTASHVKIKRAKRNHVTPRELQPINTKNRD